MRKSPLVIFTILSLLIVSQAAFAEGFGVTGKIGTLGIGADATYSISPKLNVRGNINGFNYSFSDIETSGTTGAQDFGVDLELFSLGAVLDYHPNAGRFRLSGGLYNNQTKAVLDADITQSIDFAGVGYTVSDFEGEVGFSSLAPYLGIGLGDATSEGKVHFAMDIGVMMVGSPEAELTATASNPLLQILLDAAIAAEIEEQNEDLDVISIYPVVSLGISVAF
ncbi:MAG: hypothetical protein KOO60_02360 [Gemmatimonadales bacterium]|nr:hypothetical protein [Gemmatimonadales bacterium]